MTVGVRTTGNRRKSKRFVRRCEVEFSSDDSAKRGIASDFSLGGLFIRTNYPFPAGTSIDIVMYYSNGTTSRLKGRVKRAMVTAIGKVIGTPVKALKNGMGVEVTEKDANYLHFIRSLLG